MIGIIIKDTQPLRTECLCWEVCHFNKQVFAQVHNNRMCVIVRCKMEISCNGTNQIVKAEFTFILRMVSSKNVYVIAERDFTETI